MSSELLVGTPTPTFTLFYWYLVHNLSTVHVQHTYMYYTSGSKYFCCSHVYFFLSGCSLLLFIFNMCGHMCIVYIFSLPRKGTTRAAQPSLFFFFFPLLLRAPLEHVACAHSPQRFSPHYNSSSSSKMSSTISSSFSHSFAITFLISGLL